MINRKAAATVSTSPLRQAPASLDPIPRQHIRDPRTHTFSSPPRSPALDRIARGPPIRVGFQ